MFPPQRPLPLRVPPPRATTADWRMQRGSTGASPTPFPANRRRGKDAGPELAERSVPQIPRSIGPSVSPLSSGGPPGLPLGCRSRFWGTQGCARGSHGVPPSTATFPVRCVRAHANELFGPAAALLRWAMRWTRRGRRPWRARCAARMRTPSRAIGAPLRRARPASADDAQGGKDAGPARLPASVRGVKRGDRGTGRERRPSAP